MTRIFIALVICTENRLKRTKPDDAFQGFFGDCCLLTVQCSLLTG